MHFFKKNIALFSTFLLSFFITIIFRNEVFLWDNITTTSAPANYFYFHGWHIFSLGNFIDCGHPPLMSLYYALCWKILGRNLLLSHLAQMPFLWLLFYQFFLLMKKMFDNENQLQNIFSTSFLLLADTTFLSQAGQVGFEISVVAFFLLATNILWKRVSSDSKNNFLYVFCLVILPLMQLRGIPVVMALCLVEIIFQFQMLKNNFKKIILTLLPYTISAIILCAWLRWHYVNVGYLFSDPKSSWGADNVAFAGFHRMIFNLPILVLRWLDNGRILLCLAMLLASIYFFKKTKQRNFQQFLFIIWCSISLLLSLNFILMPKPICHRYLLPALVLIPLLTVYFFTQTSIFKRKIQPIFLVCIFVIFSIAGNFFFYFERYSIGWDSTLAHLPYKNLRKEAFQFAVENKINAEKCGSRFPLDVSDSLVNLTSQKWICQSANETDLNKFEYVLYSNICTSFTVSQKQMLTTEYHELRKWESGKVVFVFYQKN